MSRYPNMPNAELIQGVVKEQPMSSPHHGYICARMTALIFNHVDANGLGRVMSNNSRVQVGPESVRGGVVLFFS